MFTGSLSSQTLIDTLILHSNDTIPCKITYVNSYSVFMKYQKKKKKKSEKNIPRIKIKKMIVNTTGLTIMTEKIDESINDYNIKSKLDKKLDVLLIDSITAELVLIGKKYFEFNQYNNLSIYQVEMFAKRHNCKLVYIKEDVLKKKAEIQLFEGSLKYYERVFEKYNTNSVFILQSEQENIECANFNFEKKEYEICSNEYIIFEKPKTDTISKNEYYNIEPQDGVELKSQSIRFNLEKYKMIKTSLISGEYYKRRLKKRKID